MSDSNNGGSQQTELTDEQKEELKTLIERIENTVESITSFAIARDLERIGNILGVEKYIKNKVNTDKIEYYINELIEIIHEKGNNEQKKTKFKDNRLNNIEDAEKFKEKLLSLLDKIQEKTKQQQQQQQKAEHYVQGANSAMINALALGATNEEDLNAQQQFLSNIETAIKEDSNETEQDNSANNNAQVALQSLQQKTTEVKNHLNKIDLNQLIQKSDGTTLTQDEKQKIQKIKTSTIQSLDDYGKRLERLIKESSNPSTANSNITVTITKEEANADKPYPKTPDENAIELPNIPKGEAVHDLLLLIQKAVIKQASDADDIIKSILANPEKTLGTLSSTSRVQVDGQSLPFNDQDNNSVRTFKMNQLSSDSAGATTTTVYQNSFMGDSEAQRNPAVIEALFTLYENLYGNTVQNSNKNTKANITVNNPYAAFLMLNLLQNFKDNSKITFNYVHDKQASQKTINKWEEQLKEKQNALQNAEQALDLLDANTPEHEKADQIIQQLNNQIRVLEKKIKTHKALVDWLNSNAAAQKNAPHLSTSGGSTNNNGESGKPLTEVIEEFKKINKNDNNEICDYLDMNGFNTVPYESNIKDLQTISNSSTNNNRGGGQPAGLANNTPG